MGYTVTGKIRLIRFDGKVYKPFHGTLHCDPCAVSSKRYEVSGYARCTVNGVVQDAVDVRPWYGVITPDDKYRDVLVKVAYAKKVEEARLAYDAAKRVYDNLTF
jgi:hypothetical protein